MTDYPKSTAIRRRIRRQMDLDFVIDVAFGMAKVVLWVGFTLANALVWGHIGAVILIRAFN